VSKQHNVVADVDLRVQQLTTAVAQAMLQEVIAKQLCLND